MRRGWTVGLLGLLAAVAAAQDPKPADPAAKKADPGAVPATFRSYIATDERFPPTDPRNRAKKVHCLVVENGLNPVCAVFTRADPGKAAAGPLGTLVKQLNGVVQKYRANNAAAFVVFLTLDKPYPDEDYKVRAEKAAAVQALAQQVASPGVPFGLASGTKEEPDKPGPLTAWGIADTDDTVVLVYQRMRVAKRPDGMPARWAFPADKPMTDDDVKAIVAAFEKEAKGG